MLPKNNPKSVIFVCFS